MEGGNFVDYVKLFVRSGNGGSGSMHFRREKYVPKGGPDGGDGGRGGHVILRGNSQLWTLLHLKYRKHIHADNGNGGEGGLRSGAQGNDIIIEVPIGTVAKDELTGQVEAEILHHGQEFIWLKGGRGGQGNNHFKTSTNQAPHYAQQGETGFEGWKILELKILADVGLVGFPNAGKSTLLSVLSAAKPEIADYAFTTLTPNLGMVYYRDERSFVMADIPGIIEGASSGKGLGYRFLRHIERNSVLLYLIPADSSDIKREFKILQKELKLYNKELMHKKFMIGITKSDLIDDELKALLIKELPKKIKYVFFSSVAQQGLVELKDVLWQLIHE
jgi:GTP-binding protein